MKRGIIAAFSVLAVASSSIAAEPQAKAVAVSVVRPKYGRGMPEGKGWFRLQLEPRTGKVLSVHVVKSTGRAELDTSATAAFKQWRFRPGTMDTVTLPIDFAHNVPRRGSQ